MENPTNRFVVGVTGHRRLFPEDIDEITRKVRLFFLETFPPDASVFVLSGLAEGADQLVAETVWDLKQKERPNFRLIGLLPMPVGFYEEDFSENPTESTVVSPRKNFYLALSRLDSSIELPLIPQNEEAALAQKPIDRLVQYDLLGSQLVRQSSILLALWDGETQGIKPGGTADVVQRALCDPDPRRVFHIVTPQNKKGRKRPENALNTQWLD